MEEATEELTYKARWGRGVAPHETNMGPLCSYGAGKRETQQQDLQQSDPLALPIIRRQCDRVFEALATCLIRAVRSANQGLDI